MIGNVLYNIVFGKRFDFNDQNLEIINRMTTIAFSADGPLSLARFLPRWVIRIIAKRSQATIEHKRQNFECIQNFIHDQIKQHEESFDANNIRDFVDLYIQVSHHSTEANEDDVFTKESIFQVIIELFLVGIETTFNTLDWAFLFMSEYPEVQEKCFKEITETVGDKIINYADRAKMRYVNATLSEIQRLGNVVTGSPHAANEDTTLLGFFIPKGTMVQPNLYSALMDPKYWNEPNKFRPERFLDEEGKPIDYKALIPFGIGPRTCLGEPLARIWSYFSYLQT